MGKDDYLPVVVRERDNQGMDQPHHGHEDDHSGVSGLAVVVMPNSRPTSALFSSALCRLAIESTAAIDPRERSSDALPRI